MIGNIPSPPINGDPAAQIRALTSYLFQLAELLNHNINETQKEIDEIKGKIKEESDGNV